MSKYFSECVLAIHMFGLLGTEGDPTTFNGGNMPARVPSSDVHLDMAMQAATVVHTLLNVCRPVCNARDLCVLHKYLGTNRPTHALFWPFSTALHTASHCIRDVIDFLVIPERQYLYPIFGTGRPGQPRWMQFDIDGFYMNRVLQVIQYIYIV